MRAGWVVREAVESDARAMIAFAREIFREPGVMVPARPEEFSLTVAEEVAVIRRHYDRENAIFLLAAAEDGALIGMWNCFGSDRQVRGVRHVGSTAASRPRGGI